MIPSLRALSRDEVRQLDVEAAAELALPTIVLMENAGRGAAGWLAELVGAIAPCGGRPFSTHRSPMAPDLPHGPPLPRVLIVCGPGNNGGDGGVVARHLDAWGFPVRVIWFVRNDQIRGDAAVQWSILRKSGVEQSAWFDEHTTRFEADASRLDAVLADADWLVDGLLGTGLSRPVDGPTAPCHRGHERFGKTDLRTGSPLRPRRRHRAGPLGVAVRACATATFVAAKLGFNAAGAADYTGAVAVIDIGLPRRLLQPYFQMSRHLVSADDRGS